MSWKYFNSNGKILTWNHQPIREFDTAPPSPFPLEGLLARWTFDNEDLVDSYNGYALTATGSTSYTFEVGKVGAKDVSIDSAVNLDNTSDPELLVPLYYWNPFTFAWWQKGPFNMSSAMFISKHTDGEWSGDDNFYINFYSGSLVLSRRPSGGDSYTSLPAGWDSDTDWHHIVQMYTDAKHSVVYFDGVLGNDVLYDVDSTDVGNTFTIHQTRFGGFPSGELDNIYYYNRSLTESEVLQLYNNGNGI